MKRVEHIGIAVSDLQVSVATYEQLLNTACYKKELVESEGVKTAFLKAGESKIELLEAIQQESPIAKFISAKGEGIHHIAFEVEDIYEEMERLKTCGFRLLSERPKIGADNKLVCFVHPKDAHGVLVELCQEIKSA